jgi:hypothetical protein
MDLLLSNLTASATTSMRSLRGVLGMRCAAWAASALMVCALQPVFATNGVVDINQARAVAGGVTAGDTPGFPITISESGSYRLTSNIDITGVASPLTTTAIEITAPDVSLDLNGFAVIGPVLCSGGGATISCLPAPGGGAGADLIASTTAAPRFSLRNGSVRGAGGTGVFLAGLDSSVRDLIATSNYGGGVKLVGIADNVRVVRNRTIGLTAINSEAALFRIYARENSSHGVSCLSTQASRAVQVHATSNGVLGVKDCAFESSHFFNNNGAVANVQITGLDVGNNVCYRGPAATACP